VPHPEKSDLRLLTSPIRIDGRRAKLTPCPPLGADNDELLQQ
jgi:hypothetical protein